MWQKRSLTAASPRIHPKPLHKPLFCSCHFPEEKPRAQDPRNPDTTGNSPMDRVRERNTGKYSLDEDPITPDAPQAPSQATFSFVPLPPPRQHRHSTPLRPIFSFGFERHRGETNPFPLKAQIRFPSTSTHVATCFSRSTAFRFHFHVAVTYQTKREPAAACFYWPREEWRP